MKSKKRSDRRKDQSQAVLEDSRNDDKILVKYEVELEFIESLKVTALEELRQLSTKDLEVAKAEAKASFDARTQLLEELTEEFLSKVEAIGLAPICKRVNGRTTSPCQLALEQFGGSQTTTALINALEHLVEREAEADCKAR